jgi:hypothetical protein
MFSSLQDQDLSQDIVRLLSLGLAKWAGMDDLDRAPAWRTWDRVIRSCRAAVGEDRAVDAC